MKVGDLVRIRHDEHLWLGHGIILELRGGEKAHYAKVRWFDQWDEQEFEWEVVSALEVISESR